MADPEESEGRQRSAPKGDKSLVGDKRYRKFLQSSRKQFAVDQAWIDEESRYDG